MTSSNDRAHKEVVGLGVGALYHYTNVQTLDHVLRYRQRRANNYLCV